MSKVFITFGGGCGPDNLPHHKNIKDACKRLISQANDSNFFDKTIGYTDEYLKNDLEFWNKHGEFINNHKKGYGYWIWKSYIIKKTMESMNDGDILLYLDAGCEIDKSKPDHMEKLFNQVIQHKILYTGSGFPELTYTKKDLFIELGLYTEEIGQTQQCAGGVIMFLVNNEMRKLVNDWYRLSSCYHFIDESPSKSSCQDIVIYNIRNNTTTKFSEHRHDQSILSLLIKKYGYKYYNIVHGNKAITINRNRTGISKLK